MRKPGKITGSDAGITISRISSPGFAPRHSAALIWARSMLRTALNVLTNTGNTAPMKTRK
jgi:hypothetical protein